MDKKKIKPEEERTFSASLDQLYHMLAFIRDYSENLSFDSMGISKIELACEEALVNIISYGYSNPDGNIEINCSVADESGIRIVIKDYGVPYNPLEQNKNPGEETIGGYGIYFIKKLMDEVRYEREEKANILTLVKYS